MTIVVMVSCLQLKGVLKLRFKFMYSGEGYCPTIVFAYLFFNVTCFLKMASYAEWVMADIKLKRLDKMHMAI